jgi:apolipoprotein N-acyltransferase
VSAALPRAAAWRDSAAWPTALAALGGGAHALSIAPRPLWALQWAAVALLALLVWRAAPRRAAWLGGVFSLTWLAGSVWWLFISMHRYGGLPAWMAALAVLALCAALALYLAAAMAVHARWRHGHGAVDAARFAALWLLAELARGVLFTGFPWAAAGYAHVDGPLAALAPWIGVYGIGAVAALAGASAVWLASASGGSRSVRTARVGALAIVLALGVPLLQRDFTQPGGGLNVTLLQGNIPQDEKFESTHVPQALAWHVRGLFEAKGDLVLAPETAVPLLPSQMPADLWPAITQHFSQGSTHALFGVPLGSFEEGYTNSVVGLAPGRDGEYRYNKHHLVPFGEFIPWGFRWFVDMMNIPLGDFARGPLAAPSFAVRGERIAPNICYEDLFGEELAARFRDEAAAPTIFANISNIGWFGDTIAIDQHRNISRMRALEFQRPMLRATNTGATVIIDHRGAVTHALPPFTVGVLEGTVQGRAGLTPFARWASWAGLWPYAALALAVLGAGLRRRRADS